uniref:Global nitrogen transcriptional regulator n=1 Tax=Halydictyon mirabile TaxID=189652 RepID=A0A4D6WSZ5_9FLOR|nr:global nitrogen transcriptional regulator [Halydictyon mirabile]
MKWINNFSKSKTPYYIYKLNKNDRILYKAHSKLSKSIIILDGYICIFKIFNNKRVSFLYILTKNNIIHLYNRYLTNEYYYDLVACETSYIISFSLDTLTQKIKFDKSIFHDIIKAQELTLNISEIIHDIYKQKYLQNKLLQFILFNLIQFGKIKNHRVIIPFYLTQNILAIILKTNKKHINQIMIRLSKKNIYNYSSKQIIKVDHIFNLINIFAY